MAAVTVARETRAASWPLTEAQDGLWTAQRLEPDNPIYNTGQIVELSGPLDRAAFAEAVGRALAETPALTVCIIAAEDGARQVAAPAPACRVIDLTHSADPEAEARAAIARDMATPCDPSLGGLVAEILFVLGPARHLWFQRIHHAVVDGFGTGLLTARIAEIYTALLAQQDTGAPLAPYEAVVAEDAAYRASERRAVDRAFWLDSFADRPEVVGMAPGTALTAHDFHRRDAALDPACALALQRLATEHRLAWPDVLVALTGLYVRRHTGSPEAVLGVPSMNRLGSAAARVPCMAMNVLPVRIAAAEDLSLVDFVTETSRTLRQARRHGRYRSEQLRRDLGLLGGAKRLFGPLVNVLPFDQAFALPGIDRRDEVLGTGPVDDLTFTFRADAALTGLRLEIDANPRLYAEAEVAAHATRLAEFLRAALASDRLRDVPTATPAETRHLIHEVNATAHDVPRTTLAALIDAALKHDPDAAALETADEVLSRGEVDGRSLALAQQLAARAIGRGDIVAVALPRSGDLVLALLAILRTGAAYLPLDLGHPPERIATILASARPRLVVTTGDAADTLPAGTPVLRLDPPAAEAPDAQLASPEPDDAAYVIYTSGSTGMPKGVVVTHDAIVNRLKWMQAHYGIGPGDRILQKTPATFDVSVWEFFLPFLSGATLVVAPHEAHKDPERLAAVIRRHGVNVAHFVPSMLSAFLSEPSSAGLDLRLVFCSGEELPAATRDRFHTRFRAELHNLYGPTEAAVDVTYWPAGRDDRSVPVPIGFPVWNTAMYVLDGGLRPVPVGVAGDLYLAGRQLAREYLGRPDLTAERFIPDPFNPRARMYRTGDIAQRRPDGALVYLGRSDHQIKIRGLRIELGEIEAVLAAVPGVAQVAVLAREDRPGDQRLVAYVVPAGLEVAALRAQAAALLPDYMVPSAFVTLDALPVTANGKLDRKALPAPDFSPAEGRAPETATERRLAALYADVLGLDHTFGADDDFFDLGGHSLLAAELMLRLRTEWRRNIGLGALFEHSTVVRLAAFLDRRDDEFAPAVGEGLGSPIPLRLGTQDVPALFAVHPAGGLSWCYSRLARALPPGRAVHGLQAAGIDPDAKLPATLDTMADAYIAQIQAVQPHGPYHLVGWSVGGIIAQAMAARLEARGEPVGVLAMLDSYPADCWRAEPEPKENAALKALLHIAGYDPDSLDVPLMREAVVSFLARTGHPLALLGERALEGVVRVVDSNNRLVRSHHHTLTTADVLYFRAALDHAGKNLFPQQWRPYVGAITVHDIPALHPHLVGSDATGRIAPVLAEALAAWDPKV
jgi:enterobactin synthetase component F